MRKMKRMMSIMLVIAMVLTSTAMVFGASVNTEYTGYKPNIPSDAREYNFPNFFGETIVNKYDASVYTDVTRPVKRGEVVSFFEELFRSSGNLRLQQPGNVKNFNDIGNLDEGIRYMYMSLKDMGAISGYPDGKFRPTQSPTRAEFATFCCTFMDAASLNLSYTTDRNANFADCKGHWAYNHINRMYRYGLMQGISDTRFSPESKLTVAEFLCAAEQYRLALNIPKSNFASAMGFFGIVSRDASSAFEISDDYDVKVGESIDISISELGISAINRCSVYNKNIADWINNGDYVTITGLEEGITYVYVTDIYNKVVTIRVNVGHYKGSDKEPNFGTDKGYIELNETSLTLDIGDTFKLKVSGNKVATANSDGKGVVEFNSYTLEGNAVYSGTEYITVTDNWGRQATCRITVRGGNQDNGTRQTQDNNLVLTALPSELQVGDKLDLSDYVSISSTGNYEFYSSDEDIVEIHGDTAKVVGRGTVQLGVKNDLMDDFWLSAEIECTK